MNLDPPLPTNFTAGITVVVREVASDAMVTRVTCALIRHIPDSFSEVKVLHACRSMRAVSLIANCKMTLARVRFSHTHTQRKTNTV